MNRSICQLAEIGQGWKRIHLLLSQTLSPTSSCRGLVNAAEETRFWLESMQGTSNTRDQQQAEPGHTEQSVAQALGRSPNRIDEILLESAADLENGSAKKIYEAQHDSEEENLV